MFLLSNVVRIDVRPPVSRADHAVAELASGEEQGVLMSLVGSDAPELRRGNEALRTIVERYPEHPVASVARLVHATNAAREFKAIQIDGSVNVREARTQEAAAILHRAPGLEALLHAAVLSNDEASLPRAVAELLTRVPSDVTSAHVLHPFIRSRIREIASIVPQVLASTRRELAPSGRPRRAGRGQRLACLDSSTGT